MTRGLLLLPAALALALVATSPASAQRSRERDRDTADAFAPFRAIAERNIFNPNRTARQTAGRPADVPTGPADEVIALVGTLDYEKGVFALFEGSEPAHRQALKAGGRIVGLTITAIRPTEIVLDGDGRSTRLPVGGQLRRPPGGAWTVSEAPLPLPAPPVVGGPSAASSASPATPGTPVDASETLRRLREKRQKQLKE
jgi:hypothetical protein